MAIHGDLGTMPLVEVLQWAGINRKTGVLELERNKICKRIVLREGRIVGCCSTDPSNLLGQFLISRGAITGRTLQYALREQKQTAQPLPSIFVEMGVLTEDEVADHVVTKSVETIYGLFEWEDAIFRFDSDTVPDPYTVEVDLSVEHTLLNGAQRQDDLGQIRQLFTASNIVLRRTDRSLPFTLENGTLVQQVLDLVDGERTLAEILLRSHASEFDVLFVLLSLHSDGNIELAGERTQEPCGTTLVDIAMDAARTSLPNRPEVRGPTDAEPVEGAETKCSPEHYNVEIEAVQPNEVAAGETSKRNTDLYVLLQAASSKLEHLDYEGAFTVLDTCYALKPHDDSVKKLIQTTESSYLKWAREGILRPDQIPVRAESCEEPPTPLKGAESMLLGMIDGETSIQELTWLVPLRELEVTRALHVLHTVGMIRFRESGAGQEKLRPAKS